MTHNALNNVTLLRLSIVLNNLNAVCISASYQDRSFAFLDESVFDNATPQQRKWYERMKECATDIKAGRLPKYPEIERLDFTLFTCQPSEYHVFLDSEFEIITSAKNHKYLF